MWRWDVKHEETEMHAYSTEQPASRWWFAGVGDETWSQGHGGLAIWMWSVAEEYVARTFTAFAAAGGTP